MCGLVCVISKSFNGFTAKERDVFHELLYIDTVRGDDSTGIMLVDRDGNLDLAKEATDAQNFQRSKEYQELMGKAFRSGSALIGHNRKATRGVVNDENAHPFVVDDRIVLVHNGTLYGDHKKIADVEVDSHAIAHLIHKHEDDVESALKEVNGAYALIWYDVQKRTLNFVRNSQRPLAFLETDTCWMWASEPGMLGWMQSRHQISTKETKISTLPEGELVTFTRNGNKWDREQRKLDLTTKTTHTPFDYSDYYKRRDACEMRPRHPYANGWLNPDDYDSDDVLDVPAKVVALPPPRLSLDRSRVKCTDEESRMARKNGFILKISDFGRAVYDIKDGQHYAGHPFDYEYVKGSDVLNGVYLYAKMEDDPSLMFRCYVEYIPGDATFEQRILNLCTSEKKCMFKVLTRQWHKHVDGDVSEGFGILYSKEYGVISPVVDGEVINA